MNNPQNINNGFDPIVAFDVSETERLVAVELDHRPEPLESTLALRAPDPGLELDEFRRALLSIAAMPDDELATYALGALGTLGRVPSRQQRRASARAARRAAVQAQRSQAGRSEREAARAAKRARRAARAGLEAAVEPVLEPVLELEPVLG